MFYFLNFTMFRESKVIKKSMLSFEQKCPMNPQECLKIINESVCMYVVVLTQG